jgi:hypothetical protein
LRRLALSCATEVITDFRLAGALGEGGIDRGKRRI